VGKRVVVQGTGGKVNKAEGWGEGMGGGRGEGGGERGEAGKGKVQGEW